MSPWLVTQSCLILCDPVNCSTPGFSVLHHLLELAQTHVHWVGDVIQLSHPLSSPVLLPESFPASGFLFCFFKLTLRIRWPKYRSFSFSICLSNEYSVLISFRWLAWSPCCPRDSQESSLAPKFKGISSWVLSPFYFAALMPIHDSWKKYSIDYMDLCRQSNVSAFNIFPMFVIAFLPRSKHLLISWLQSPSTMILDPKKKKSVTCVNSCLIRIYI